MADSRQIRVFISSTFRDMKEERDYLVKFTFPQLRKLCESRGVVWGEVDLRWGVTDEQKAEGKVLPICLEEIKRCRPYFIGLLGERYGWIPDAIPAEIIEREPWLAEHVHGRKSVTELEILHGVLNNPNMAEHAFFYFRDPAYVESLPADRKKDLTTENPESTEKLNNLKDRIRTSGFPVRENYPDPKALGELVLADLTAVIDKLWPEGSQPDPLDREAMDHEAYAQSRERVYIGRPEYFAKLDAHADGRGDQPLVILGESGCGKSALLANWVTHYRQSHPNVLILQHYIGATPYSADWAAMLRRLMGEFKRHFNIQQDIPDKPDDLRSTFPNWLHMAAAKGRIVLVLDALNQLEDRDGAPDLVWLPPVMPENLRLIVSTLPGLSLNEIQKRHWPALQVETLSASERKEMIGQYLAQYAKVLSPARVERIANMPQSANPLYLRVVLDELRFVRSHEELGERIGYYLEAQSPRDLYREVIARWEQDYGKGTTLVGDALSLLWAARRGLSETQLLQAMGQDAQPIPRAVWSPLYLAMPDALVSRSGLLTFAHDFLREAARDAYLPSETHQRQAHLRLADSFLHQSTDLRSMDELPWQLAKGGAWEALQALLVDHVCFVDAWDRNQFEVKTYWTQIEASSSLRMVHAYRAPIEHPDSESDKVFLNRLGLLLADTGHGEEAFRLRSALVEHFRASGDLNGLETTLGNQAVIVLDRGDLDGATALLKEQEQICRQSGNVDGLWASLSNQAHISYIRGDLDGAMALYKEQEQICRGLADLDGLWNSLGNQALILQARGDLDGAMALYREKERVCRQLGNLGELSTNLNNQAVILMDRGDLDGAMALYKENEQICRQLGDLEDLSYSLGNQALVLQHRGDLDRAMALHKEQERICRQLGNLEGLSLALGNQALILRYRGDLDGAMALHKEQERICRQLGNLAGLQASLGGQASILSNRGDLDGAMALLKEVERICRDLGNLLDLSRTLGNQAGILYDRWDLDGAVALYREDERICRQLGNLDGLSGTLGNQAVILRVRGDLDGAMGLHKEEERICRQLGNLGGLSYSLGNQALILEARGDLDGAMVLHKEAERICRQLGNVTGLQAILGNQALILEARGDLDGAMVLHKEAERICRQLSNLRTLEAILGNQANVLDARGDLDGAMALYKEQECICRRLGSLDGLASSLANQAATLSETGRAQEALPLAEQAYEIATSHGYAALAKQIEPILNKVRQAAQGG